MADARLFHKKGSHGERVIALDHLAFRVWHQYVLSADDYGVMRASSSVIRADNPKLEDEPLKKIVAAMATIEASGLVATFEHQGVKFWWQKDWQDFQQIRYPRESVNPCPPPECIATASSKQRKLFAIRSEDSQEDSGNISETPPHPAGAGGRETLTLTPTHSEDLALETEETPISTVPPTWGKNRSKGGLVRNHPHCDKATSDACARNYCVPSFHVTAWRGQVDADSPQSQKADDYLRDVVRRGLAKLPPSGPIGGTTAAKFWEQHWADEHALSAPVAVRRPFAAQDKGSRSMEAGDRAIEILREMGGQRR